MRMMLLFLVTTILISCKEEGKKGFTTVADLDSQDLVRCNKDRKYILMKYFSGGFDSIRKAKGIPSLPKDFMGMMWSVPNQLRWYNDMHEKYRSEGKPYYDRKDLGWEDSILIYDRSNFAANDSMQSWLAIAFERKQVKGTPFKQHHVSGDRDMWEYVFEYTYSDKTFQPGQHKILTKEQADSILRSWNITY